MNRFIDGPLSILHMNPLSYYHLREQPWTDQEDQTLRIEYVDQLLDIVQIADLHYKTPGQISYRLKRLGITEHYYKEMRGYDRYKNSDLFREIMANPKVRVKTEHTTEKQDIPKGHKKIKMIEEYLQIQQEQKEKIEELQLEMKSMKKDIKEILRLMNAVYDFEQQ